jgi:methionine-rich copper-binding protein CopC
MKHVLIVAAFFLAAAITPAFAHAHLASAEPADAAVLSASPSALTLRFSEAIELGFSGLVVTGPNGPVDLAAGHLDPADAEVLVVPVDTPLAAGSYSVDWHALSTDGHKSTGSYSFTVN